MNERQVFEILIVLAAVAGWISWVVERVGRERYQKRYMDEVKRTDRLLKEKLLLEWGRGRLRGE